MKIISILVVIFFTSQLFGQSFDNLKTYEKNGAEISYNPSCSELLDKSVDDGYEVFHVIKTKIDSKSSDYYLIVFDPGPSADPMYHIQKYEKNGTLTDVETMYCDKIVIPGTGLIYTSGISNRTYNKHQKYQVVNGKIAEVKQPYYYVGHKGKTMTNITLYADQQKKGIVAGLPKDYDVEVLLCDKDEWFLVKTPFGLIGWVFISKNDYPYPGNVISGIFYHGD